MSSCDTKPGMPERDPARLLDRLLAAAELAADSHEAGLAAGAAIERERQITINEAVRLTKLAARLREDRGQVREALQALLPNLYRDLAHEFSSGRLELESFRDGLLEGIAAAVDRAGEDDPR